MKHLKARLSFSVFIFFLLVVFSPVFSQTEFRISRGAIPAKEYLPGDFVQIVVEAPQDTAQITAGVPDGTIISLVRERRTNVWRGIWQVPIDFKRGTYTAKLRAIDLAGDIFEGESDAFIVGELAMIMLLGKPTKEAAPKAPLREIISVEIPKDKGAGAKPQKMIKSPPPSSLPEIVPEAKKILVERNIISGKESLSQGKLNAAAAFFRVALYLDPVNRTAGSYLAETEQGIEERKEEEERQAIFVVGVRILTGVAGAALLFWLVVFLRRSPGRFMPAAGAPGGLEAPPAVSEAEKRKFWLEKAGWKVNPFSMDAIKQIFAGDNRLEIDGFKNFIRARIESAGGRNLLPFTDSAIDELFSLSKGKPKTAAKICEWAVNQAILNNQFQVTAEIVKGYEKIMPASILIADDEEIIRTTLEAILKKGGGYETDFAADGEEALKKIKGNIYGLVLLDVAMPKLDGYEVLRQVRAIYPDLPVVFVTGKGTPQKTLESIDKYGLTGYIEKPFTPEKVLDVVARTLKAK